MKSTHILSLSGAALATFALLSQTHAEDCDPIIPDLPIPCACSPLEQGYSAPSIGLIEDIERRGDGTWVTLTIQRQTIPAFAPEAKIQGRLADTYPCGQSVPVFTVGQSVLGLYGPFECPERDACLDNCGDTPRCKQTCDDLQSSCTFRETPDNATWLLYPYEEPAPSSSSQPPQDIKRIEFGTQDGVDYTLSYSASSRSPIESFTGLQTCARAFPSKIEVPTSCGGENDNSNGLCSTAGPTTPSPTPWHSTLLLMGCALLIRLRT